MLIECTVLAEPVADIWMEFTYLLRDGNEGVVVLCRSPALPPLRGKVSWSSPRASGAPTTIAASSPQRMTRPYEDGTFAQWGELYLLVLVWKYSIPIHSQYIGFYFFISNLSLFCNPDIDTVFYFSSHFTVLIIFLKILRKYRFLSWWNRMCSIIRWLPVSQCQEE